MNVVSIGVLAADSLGWAALLAIASWVILAALVGVVTTLLMNVRGTQSSPDDAGQSVIRRAGAIVARAMAEMIARRGNSRLNHLVAEPAFDARAGHPCASTYDRDAHADERTSRAPPCSTTFLRSMPPPGN